MKKFLSTLLIVAMVLSLAACGKKNNNDDNSDANAPYVAPDMTKTVTLNFWSICVPTDSNRDAYDKAIADMKAKYPNITLNELATQNDEYKGKIKDAFQAGQVADIFLTWCCAFLGDFVQAGQVYCLDNAFKDPDVKDAIDVKMCNNTIYNGKKYGVPLTMNIVTLFANLDILKEVGYSDVPATYDELMTCCDKLVAAGKIPFGCAAGAGQEWCVTEYVESIIEKSCGAKTLDDIFQRRASWGNADVANAINKFQEMIKKGYFDPNGQSMDNEQVKTNFMAGKYAFYINGSWNCADFAKADGLNVKASEFPVIDSTKSKLGQLIGGPSDTLAVFGKSENKEIAAKYALELGRLICKYCYLSGAGLPAWKVDYPATDINTLTQAVADIVAKSDYLVLFGDTAMNSADKDIYLKEIAKVYGAQVDGQKFIDDLKGAIK